MLKHTNWALRICLLSFITLVSVMSVKAQITFNASNKSIKEVIEMIEEKADYSFFYSDELSDLNRKVNLSFHDENIENVLRTLFKGTNIVYKIEGDKQVVLSLQSTLKKAKSNKSVSGKIVDTEGNPLIGVSIAVDNGARGTMSDVDGNWKLEASEGSLLTFSYIGYNTHTLRVGSKDVYTVSMSEDNQLLDEVVVIGYGSMKRKDITTAVSVVSTSDIDERPIVDAAQALQGKAAGIQVVQPSGAPGSGMSIRVRGATSVQASNEPLYIVDGMPSDDISGLNPGDIESMQVLKDASSAAIYGARAANGVVLITTKRGEIGKPQVKLSAYAGISRLGKKIDALNTEEYKDLMKELKKYSNVAPTIPEDEHRYVDWTDMFC